MTTFWDAAPNEKELELWWLVAVDELEPQAAAGKIGWDAERAGETVQRVEAFLQAAKQVADERAEGRLAAAPSGERLEALFAEAAGAILASWGEQQTVNVRVKNGRVEKVVITRKPSRPKRAWLRAILPMAKALRERRAKTPARTRLPGPSGAA